MRNADPVFPKNVYALIKICELNTHQWDAPINLFSTQTPSVGSGNFNLQKMNLSFNEVIQLHRDTTLRHNTQRLFGRDLNLFGRRTHSYAQHGERK